MACLDPHKSYDIFGLVVVYLFTKEALNGSFIQQVFRVYN